LPVGGVSGGDSSFSNSGGGTASPYTAPASSTASRPARVYRLRFSRDWISRTGPKKRRQTVLVFVLKKAALVEFVVIEVAPDCRRVGRFRVVGRRGVNRVRFRGRIGRRALGPGTYRIMARALPRGRALVDTKLVVVARPERDEISSGRRANACGSESRGQSTSSTASASASTPAKPTAARPPATEDKAEERATPSPDKGVLGAKFTKRAVEAVKSIPLWLFALLGLAIAILAVAALPMRAAPSRRAAFALAHHRSAFAVAGAALLLVVMVAYTLALGAP
jgi:hypothetical protein